MPLAISSVFFLGEHELVRGKKESPKKAAFRRPGWQPFENLGVYEKVHGESLPDFVKRDNPLYSSFLSIQVP